jgi:hypothetical protein
LVFHELLPPPPRRYFAAGKQKKGAGKTERVQNESEKKGKRRSTKKQMPRKNTKRRKQLVDGIAAVVVIRDAAEFCLARLLATRLLSLVQASLDPSLPAWLPGRWWSLVQLYVQYTLLYNTGSFILVIV